MMEEKVVGRGCRGGDDGGGHDEEDDVGNGDGDGELLV